MKLLGLGLWWEVTLPRQVLAASKVLMQGMMGAVGLLPEPPHPNPCPTPCPAVGYDPKNKQHRSLLLCLLMTSCDLSDQTKGWKTTRKIAVSAVLWG